MPTSPRPLPSTGSWPLETSSDVVMFLGGPFKEAEVAADSTAVVLTVVTQLIITVNW